MKLIDWLGALLVASGLMIFFSLVNRIDVAGELARGYHLCPPPGPGLTDNLVMVIKSTADDRPTVTSCVRIAERKYIPKPTGTVQKMAHR